MSYTSVLLYTAHRQHANRLEENRNESESENENENESEMKNGITSMSFELCSRHYH
jgi:hypothetical protein